MSIKRTKYTPMRGADFTNEPALVDNDRAPICENIIPDGAGYPEKRPGYRTLKEYEGKIYGLHKYTFGGVTKMLVHEGKRLWIDGAERPLCEDMAENVSRSYQNNDDLIILDGENYRVYSEKSLEKLGIPFIAPQKEGAVLSRNGYNDIITVYEQFTGNVKKNYQSYEEMEGDVITHNDVTDKMLFKMDVPGWYVWVIRYTDSDGNEVQKGYTFHSVINEEVTDEKLYMYKEEGTNNAVLVYDENEYVQFDYLKWGYVGEEDKEYTSDAKALEGCTDIQSIPKNTSASSGYKLYMPKAGFYRFCVMACQNNYPYNRVRRIFTLYANEFENGFTLYSLGKDDTINRIKSEGKHTDGGAYIPTTSISNTAIAYNSGNTVPSVMNGVGYEKVNKLSPWRRMTAVGHTEESSNSTTTQVIVLDDNYGGELVGNEMTIETVISSEDRYFKFTKAAVFVNGIRHNVAAAFDPETNEMINGDYYAGRDMGNYFGINCTFLTKNTILLWYINATPPVTGRDNIEIYYKAETDEDNDIQKCTVISEYDNNLFVTGNPDKPNFDWHSYVENPYYFPDLNYQKFGDNTAVLGYVNTGEYQAIVKADGAAGGSIYIRSVAEFNGERAYPVKQMASGVGGVSKDGFCSLIGDDLMLTKQGIFAFTTIDMTGEKTLSNRSWYVDKKLTKENLQNANMFVWQGKCFCAVEDRVYILNAESSMSRNHKYDTLYDCYYWTNVPMNRVLVVNGELFFSNGKKLCRFNTDIEEADKYNDDGAPIVARWGTKLDDDGDITRYKTMIKKGNTVTVKPFIKSSAKVYVRTENDEEKEVKYGTADVFDWTDIDFNRFTFETNRTLREIIVNSKVKKYKRLQFIVENDAVNEGFGIIEINKHYAFGNFIKR